MSRNQLPYGVECRSLYVFFEKIAAFDCVEAAASYAEQCRTANPQTGFDPRPVYRVTKNGKVVS